jgi:hypothetical protein
MGCNFDQPNRPKTIELCALRLCDKRKGRFCHSCPDFPCGRLEHLDTRYRKRYGMSEIENLNYIKANGIKKFIERERKRWVSAKGVFCVHDKTHY